MTSYATVDDLASFLKMDLDTSTAQLALDTASELFAREANTWFLPVSKTFQVQGLGWTELYLPFRPIISIQQVRITSAAGTLVITDYTRIKTVMYRLLGWGVPARYPPDLVEVDVTYGYSAVPNDVKGVVLETAGTAYMLPHNTTSAEAIDDYSVKFTNIAGMMLTPSAMDLAMKYKGTWAA